MCLLVWPAVQFLLTGANVADSLTPDVVDECSQMAWIGTRLGSLLT